MECYYNIFLSAVIRNICEPYRLTHFSILVNSNMSKTVNSWLTISNQIVKSLSLCYKKSYFFDIVQPIDLIFCKMIEMIEQKIFNCADFYLGPNFLFLARSIFSADGVIHIKSGNPI